MTAGPHKEHGRSQGNGKPFPILWMTGSYLVLSLLVTFAVRRLVATSAFTPSTVPAGIVTWQVFVAAAAFLLLIGFVLRKLNVRLFYELLLGVTLFLGVWVFMWFILPWEIGLLIAAGLTILQARVRRTLVHDAFILIGAAGIALHFAFIFSLPKLGIILVAFLIYDMFAGRPGGIAAHLASTFIHRGAIPGLIVPASWKQAAGGISVVVTSPDAVFLGAGDLILPLILVVRAAGCGIPHAAAVSAGLLIGAYWLSLRGASKPFPALVPLLLGAGAPFIILSFLHLV
jgi:presenilin-like A22 family membrane protease